LRKSLPLAKSKGWIPRPVRLGVSGSTESEHCKINFCDAKMYHMKTASIRDLRYQFKKIERLLHQGEEVQITKRRRVIARLVPESAEAPKELPDFLARLRTIYGNKALAVSGAELVSSDRSRY